MKKRWSWNRWLAALDAAKIDDKSKHLGREIAVTKKGRIVPWDLKSDWNYGDFYPLCLAGLLYLIPCGGVFAVILEPAPPPASIAVSRAMRLVIRQLLSGRQLYRINRPGYITQRSDKRKWVLRDKEWSSRQMRLDEAAAQKLVSLGIIEPDGTGHGWPFQWTNRFRLRMQRLRGVRGFGATANRWLHRELANRKPSGHD